jgi:hypothetical protein
MKIVVARAWDIKPPYHGGKLRSHQLKEDLENEGFELEEVHIGKTKFSIKCFRFSVIGLCALFNPKISRLTGIKQFIRYLRARILLKQSSPNLVIIEDTQGPHWFYACRSLKLDCVAVPHNIESLNDPNCREFSKLGGIFGLLDELKLISSYSKSVATISHEEFFLFNKVTPNVEVYPYFPPKFIIERCELVRAKRKTSQKRTLLLVGSRQMGADADTLELLKELSNNEFEAVLCGNGTDYYKEFNLPGINVLGRVSEVEYLSLLATSSAAILYNKSGSGVLTRVYEIAYSGIPIYLNYHAARSISEIKDLFIYYSLKDLICLLKSIHKKPSVESNIYSYGRKDSQKGFQCISAILGISKCSRLF